MLTKKELSDVAKLCQEVQDLIESVMNEANTVQYYDVQARQFATRARWPIMGGTKLTGALRRKSLDLTRALAQMRKP